MRYTSQSYYWLAYQAEGVVVVDNTGQVEDGHAGVGCDFEGVEPGYEEVVPEFEGVVAWKVAAWAGDTEEH